MRLKTITFLCILVNILVSCEGYDIDKNNTVTKSFLGDIIVTNNDGTTFIDQDIRITFTKSLNNDGYDIFLKKVKFAEKMPIRINMTIPSVTKNSNGEIIGDNIIPWAMGGPFEKWKIKNLVGSIEYDENNEPKNLQFNMICGGYPVSYSGIYTEED